MYELEEYLDSVVGSDWKDYFNVEDYEYLLEYLYTDD